MKNEDVKLISNLGQSLWARPEQSASITRETLSATAILDPNPDQAIEKAVQVLLERANQKGMYARVPSGFNALFPEERFILLALHSNGWSYERIARVLGETVEMVQQLSWNARVYLAISHYPVAPVQAGASCPEYNPQRPWTQRFLDEETAGQEKLFLQSHLEGCTPCREALVRAKDVYYRVQAKIDKMEKNTRQPGLTGQLDALIERGRQLRYPKMVTPQESIVRFLSRTEIRLVLAAWAFVIYWHFRH